jgi:hypothetical protein
MPLIKIYFNLKNNKILFIIFKKKMYFDNTIKEDIAIPIIDTLIDRDDTRYRDNVIKKYIKFKN